MLTRRILIASSSLIAAPFTLRAQALLPVRLLVTRRMGVSPTNQCVAPCIRGSVFDVSELPGDINNIPIPLLSVQKPLCDVIERPWKNNKPNVSSIPKGVYAASIRTDRSKSWMNNENRSWRIELSGTPNRTAIQFHYGQDVAWSEGCFIVGTLLQSGDTAGITSRYCSVENGEQAIAALRAAISGKGRDSSKISIGVADQSGLFPGLQPKEPC